jgi:hypothetical protein
MVTRPSILKIAPTDAGCVIRVEGDGTMGQSPAAREVALNTLGADPTRSSCLICRRANTSTARSSAA